jgi:hypothetical protein
MIGLIYYCLNSEFNVAGTDDYLVSITLLTGFEILRLDWLVVVAVDCSLIALLR